MDNEEQIFTDILNKIEKGASVKSILEAKDMPSRPTFYKWLKRGDSDRINRYAHATTVRADHIFDEMFDIADDGSGDYKVNNNGEEVLNSEHVQRSKLRIDARKWALAKMNPTKYGDKVGLEHSGTIGGDKINLNINFQDFADDEKS